MALIYLYITTCQFGTSIDKDKLGGSQTVSVLELAAGHLSFLDQAAQLTSETGPYLLQRPLNRCKTLLIYRCYAIQDILMFSSGSQLGRQFPVEQEDGSG